MITISSTREAEDEPRVALTPETTKKFKNLGARIVLQAGAGERSFMPDRLFQDAGAEIVSTAADALSAADIVLKVGRPSQAEIDAMKPGAVFAGMIDPFGTRDGLEALAAKGALGFRHGVHAAHHPRAVHGRAVVAVEPRRLQGGDRCGRAFGRALPMMMTAAGTVPAGTRVHHGRRRRRPAGHRHGRRLGAVVTATDVRPAAKEQVQGLGAKFIAVEDEEFKQAETAGGYAKEMSREYQAEAGRARGQPHRQTRTS